MATLRQKIALRLERHGREEAILLGHAVAVGVDQLYREEMRAAYLRGELPRTAAEEALGADEVAQLDYARRAVAADVAWGLTA